MIAAIYARKSTDQNLPDEEKSVTRQVERATAYAQAKGWTVAAEHVHADDGISGAEFVKRPGFLRLMNALKPRPPFQVLIMSEESRLGREQIETAYALKQITDAGVRVFFYLEDRERTLDSAMDKVMLSLTNFAAEMEREKASQRTYDAIRRKAERHQVAGGIVYGYDNVEVLSPALGPDGKARREHVVRKINDAQADVVRRIFQRCAEGSGLVRTAKALTDEGIAKPKGKGRGWAPSAIREMLHRELYRGRIVWNKMQRVHRGGTHAKRRRPESEWLVLDAPELRIIPEPLWQAAHAALEQKQAAYLRMAGGKLIGRPEGSRESPYLLTGLSACSLCGGSIYATRRTHGRHVRTYYGCFYHRSRGAKACENDLTVPMDEANRLLLDALGRDVLMPAMVTGTLEDTLAAWQAEGVPAIARRETIEARLRVLEAELGRLTDMLAAGAGLTSVREALQARERERADLHAQLEHLDGLTRFTEGVDSRALREDLGARLADWQGLLERQPIQARQILRKLLVGRLIFEPFEDAGGRGYTLRGQATYGRLLSGVYSVVPPG
jgi:site-specific DNA recombinase